MLVAGNAGLGAKATNACVITTPARLCCNRARQRRLVIAEQKGKLGDDLLDYVMAGPKMRKWYGQADRPTEVPRPPGQGDGDDQQDEEEEEEDVGEGDAILVTDADTPTGEQVVLQLILARANLRILVRDTVAAKSAYGPYATPVSLDPSNPALLKRVLKGCGSVVCLGRPGAIPQVAKEAGVAHVLLLSAAGTAQQGGFLSSLFSSELSALRDPAREKAVAGSGVRYTIVRVGGVKDAPGGASAIALKPVTTGISGSNSQPVCREDLASVIVQALLRPPATARAFEVCSGGAGSPPSDWAQLLAAIPEVEPAIA